MTRSLRYKEECENSKGELHDNYMEGTSARTRPLSYDEIMLRRTSKESAVNQDTDGTDVLNVPLARDDIERSAHSLNSNRHLNEVSTASGTRHTSKDSLETSSGRKRDANVSRKNEISGQDKDKGPRGTVPKLKSTVEKNVTSNRVTGGEDENHYHRNRKKDGLLDDYFHNGSDKRQDRDLVKKEKDSEKMRAKSKKDKKHHHHDDRHVHRKRKTDEHVGIDSENEPKKKNARDVMLFDTFAERSRDKFDKESRHKRHHEEGERNQGRSSGRKHDSDKKGLDTTPYHEESKSKKRRSRSRERKKVKNRRSVSHSPKVQKRTVNQKRDYGDITPKYTEERSEREHLNVDKKRISSNGSSSHYRRNTTSSSGLGGYSPRKRKTDAAAKTPSPTQRSPERRTAGWDLPPAGKEIVISGSTPPGLTISSQTLLSNAKELPTSTPMAPTMVKPVTVFPHILSSQMRAVESIQLTQATRPMRRLYVENLPALVSEKDLIECINNYLLSSGVKHIQGTRPCISCIMHKEKGQALLEFLTPEDASAALSLNGFSFAGSNLKLRRPKDYTEVTIGLPDKFIIAVDSIIETVEDSPNKIFIGGVSKVISSEMLLEIAKSFGSVKAFRFDFIADFNEPCAFIEYVDHSVSSKACACLNGMRLGGQVLTAVFATPDSTSLENVGKDPFYGVPEHAKPLLQKPTAVLELKNVVDSEGLLSLPELELEEILEDIRLECSRFGTVKSVNVVKPTNPSGTMEACEPKDPNGFNLELRNESIVGERLGEIINEQGQPDKSEPLAALNEYENKIEDAADNKGYYEDEGATSVKSSRSPSDEAAAETRSGEECELLSNIINTSSHNDPINQEKVDNCEGESAIQLNASVIERSCDDNVSDPHSVSNIEIGSTTLAEDQLDLENKNTEKANASELRSGQREDTPATIAVSADYKDVFEPGCVFVEYRRPESACTAAHSLHGRTFDGRVVTVGYVDPELYFMRFRK